MHRPPSTLRRFATALALAGVLVGVAVVPAAYAADRGTGFGTWAPLSRTGWHGSMRVGDVHTYCIHPGLPVATGTTTDHGDTGDVNGLSPQQLVSINYLVSTYGQTDDPIQAASVGWAVKAIADRETTLHSWGYGGNDLAEAIDYIMRRASPENSGAVQERTLQLLAEAENIRVPRVGGALTLSTDEDEPTRGTVTVDVDATAVGTLRLENAVFADTGSSERGGVQGRVTYPILAPPTASDGGRPYVARAAGTFTVRSAAIRYYSTPGQQESAGPAGSTTFTLTAQDASPRPVRFSPLIATSATIDSQARYVDEVTVSAGDGVWPRHSDGPSSSSVRRQTSTGRTPSPPRHPRSRPIWTRSRTSSSAPIRRSGPVSIVRRPRRSPARASTPPCGASSARRRTRTRLLTSHPTTPGWSTSPRPHRRSSWPLLLRPASSRRPIRRPSP